MTPEMCTHAIVVEDAQAVPQLGRVVRVRRCLLCGLAYDPDEHWGRLQRAIRDRYRLPPSPWNTE